MKRLLLIVLVMLSYSNYACSAENNSCYIDQKEYESRYSLYENCMIWGGGAVNPSKCEGKKAYAQSYLDKQRALCEIQKVNQAGSYDDYICKGDQNCEKKYLMQQEYTKSLQNQKVRVDANVNHSGDVNYNHYFKF